MSKPLHLGVAALLVLSGLAACDGSDGSLNQVDHVQIAEATNRSATLAQACSGCHSAKRSAFASLNGYGADAMRDRLSAYKAETDGTTVMHRLARGYSDADIDLLADYFAKDRSQP